MAHNVTEWNVLLSGCCCCCWHETITKPPTHLIQQFSTVSIEPKLFMWIQSRFLECVAWHKIWTSCVFIGNKVFVSGKWCSFCDVRHQTKELTVMILKHKMINIQKYLPSFSRKLHAFSIYHYHWSNTTAVILNWTHYSSIITFCFASSIFRFLPLSMIVSHPKMRTIWAAIFYVQLSFIRYKSPRKHVVWYTNYHHYESP